MVRHAWSARKLSRHVSPGGLLGTRPSLRLRMRWDALPSKLPPLRGYCYRHWQLVEHGWPEEWAALFAEADKGWKYLDLWADDGRHLYVEFLGYSERSPRPLLPGVVALIDALQARGVRVEVR